MSCEPISRSRKPCDRLSAAIAQLSDKNWHAYSFKTVASCVDIQFVCLSQTDKQTSSNRSGAVAKPRPMSMTIEEIRLRKLRQTCVLCDYHVARWQLALNWFQFHTFDNFVIASHDAPSSSDVIFQSSSYNNLIKCRLERNLKKRSEGNLKKRSKRNVKSRLQKWKAG